MRQKLNFYLPFLIIVAAFVGAQIYKASVMAPAPEYIWDNVYLWDWARHFSHGDFSTFALGGHHQLRWGNWGFATIMIEFFGDSVFNYYLTSIIPSVLAGIVFAYYIFKYFGKWQAFIFTILWFFDAELFRATFQLLPTSQGLLPAAVLLILTTELVTEKRYNPTVLVVLISLNIFWIYGVKETYLAFCPGVLWLMWKTQGLRAIKIFAGIFVVGYIGETLFFNWINSGFPTLGRVQQLVDGGHHLKIMTENKNYVAQQTRYFDSGITMRWVAASGVSSMVFFPAYFFALSLLGKKEKNRETEYRPVHVVAIMLLSFMFFTTFFVISIFPIRLGHGIVSRYLAIALPFSYMLVLYYLSLKTAKLSFKYKFWTVAILPFFLSPAIDRYLDYRKLSIKHISYTYDVFGQEINDYDCIRARQHVIVSNQLDLAPEKYRKEGFYAIRKNKEPHREQGWYYLRAGDSCNKTFTIHRTQTMRY